MGSPENLVAWVAHPDIVTGAILVLAGAVSLLGTGLIATLIYIWKNHKKSVEDIVTKIEDKVDSIAKSLESLAQGVEHRLTALEVRCETKEDCKPRRNKGV